ncbi:MAG: membrane protein insertion efficiency factor YidD [bacterium]|nr:membrane protein insertion efficiency factor YidD [bacterium]MDO5462660.1 membrane protein insertion efficiency factor YidD [bacterium]
MLRRVGVLIRRLLVGVLVACVRFYQRVLHVFTGHGSCRFQPTCSEYMIEALRVHGPLKGLSLGLWRILRCNPFSRGGYDPVPPLTKKQPFSIDPSAALVDEDKERNNNE